MKVEKPKIWKHMGSHQAASGTLETSHLPSKLLPRESDQEVEISH